MTEDVLPCSPSEWATYLRETWWPAVKADKTEYDYWRMKPQKRMGKFKIIQAEGQNVISE